jgi:hypothetical protein
LFLASSGFGRHFGYCLFSRYGCQFFNACSDAGCDSNNPAIFLPTKLELPVTSKENINWNGGKFWNCDTKAPYNSRCFSFYKHSNKYIQQCSALSWQPFSIIHCE